MPNKSKSTLKKNVLESAVHHNVYILINFARIRLLQGWKICHKCDTIENLMLKKTSPYSPIIYTCTYLASC